MKMSKRILCLLAVAALALSLAACGGGSGGASNYLSVMLGTNVMSLDPHLATDGDSFEVIADCIDGLMQMDESGAAVNAMAEKVDISEDGKTYTFTLRDAKWSNGTPVTANDFVFAWRRIAKGNGEYAYMLSDIGQIVNAAEIMGGTKDPSELGVTAVDEKTLKVELNVPVSYFESLMYFPTFYPVNEEFYNSLAEGTYGTSPKTYLSNGAFLLEDYTSGAASIKLKKNPDYWDAERVKLDGLKYQVVGSSDNALTAYKNKTLDLAVISGDQVSTVKADDALKNDLKVTGAGYMWYLTFSQNHSKDEAHDVAQYTPAAFNNKNLRLAFTNAIDRQSLVDNYVKDGSLATYTAVPPQFAASASTGDDFSANQEKFKDVCSFNVDKAKEYLAAAKKELGKDTFEFTMIYGNNEGDEVSKVAQAIKEQVESALEGVTITLSPMTKAERLDKMQQDNYEVALTRWGPDYADPMTYMGMWITNNPNNYGFWNNADYDAIIADCTTGKYVSDYDARWAALYDGEQIVMNEAVIAPLYTKANANLLASGVSGVEFHPVALNRVYKNAAKAAN